MKNALVLPETIAPAGGILVDEEIKRAIGAGFLIVEDKYEPKNVRQASYELRLSARIKALEFVDGASQVDAQARYVEPADVGETFEVSPGTTMLVLVEELLNIPTNVVAHVFPLGNLYKVGLLPEVTYADPGYSGEFWIIISNYSARVVSLRIGQPIARMQFTKLVSAPSRPHGGAGARKRAHSMASKTS